MTLRWRVMGLRIADMVKLDEYAEGDGDGGFNDTNRVMIWQLKRKSEGDDTDNTVCRRWRIYMMTTQEFVF